MADDDRQRGSGQLGVDGSRPATLASPEGVVLPEHASAYFSPRPPPVATAHQTIETDAVRLDPAIDPDNAVTRPLVVDGLQPPPWLSERVRSNAKTVLVPIVRARKRRRRLVVGVIAAAIGGAAGVVYGFSRPLPPRDSSITPGAPAQAAPTPMPMPTLGSAGPRTEATNPAPPTEEPATVASAPPPAHSVAIAEKTQPVPRSVPMGRRSAVPRGVGQASSAPSAWFKSEPPKPWFK
jgi:hypothetical protein